MWRGSCSGWGKATRSSDRRPKWRPRSFLLCTACLLQVLGGVLEELVLFYVQKQVRSGSYSIGVAARLGFKCLMLLVVGARNVAICARSLDQLTSTQQEVQAQLKDRGKCIAIDCDVTDENAVSRMVDTVCTEVGQIDALINNAGIGHSAKPFWELPTAEVDTCIRVNVMGVYHVTKAVLNHAQGGMRQSNNGVILNMSSAAGVRPIQNFSCYCASKFALEVKLQT